MVCLRWLLSDAADPALQQAVLTAGVLNPSSKSGKAVASDEQLELHNLDYSEDIAQFSNSTHDLTATFRKVALNGEAARLLRKMFETGIGRHASATHTVKDASVDVFSLADKIIRDGLAKQGAEGGALSLDIQQAGADLMRSRVQDLNAANRVYAEGTASVAPEALDGAEAKERVDGRDRGPTAEAVVDPEADEAYLIQGADGFFELAEGVEMVDLAGGT